MYKFLFSCIRFVYNDVHLQNTAKKYVLVIINPPQKFMTKHKLPKILLKYKSFTSLNITFRSLL